MNWIIDILLVICGSIFTSAYFCAIWEKNVVKDGYMIVSHKLYKVTEVKK